MTKSPVVELNVKRAFKRLLSNIVGLIKARVSKI